MHRTRWTAGAVLATLAATAVATVPATEGASTQAVNATAKVSGIPAFTGTVTGAPFGRGTVRGRLDLPSISATLRYSGGTVRLRGTVTSPSPVKGTWRIVGGSGSYRGTSGSGRFSGTLNGLEATLRFRGSVRR